MLEPLTTNEHTIKDFFTFAEELQSFVSKPVIVSSDKELLFTDISLQKQLTFFENLMKDN